VRLLIALLLATCTVAAAQGVRPAPQFERKWDSLAKDGVHDPRSPAIGVLQEPGAALSRLPPDTAGNQVRWVDALRDGSINPRSSLRPEAKVRLLETDILMSRYGSLRAVRFPHLEHTLWLDCSNCHEKLFKSQAGANKITMLQILQGEQCGQCHGAVAFPLTECNRCHNTARTSPKPQPAAAGAR
jgi:c(7)-type cytochrome triheme protein